jgi:HK97 family phage prohead protease
MEYMKKDETQNQLKNLSLVMDFKSIDKKSRVIRGVIGTTGNLDRHGDTVNPDGWMLDNFLKNPVIFVNHNSWNLPIAKAINVEKVENGLVFDIQFSKTLPQANEVWGLVEEKIMQAWSVGFIVLDFGRPGDEYTIMKQELLELSIVGLPANPDAMTPEKSKSIESLQKFIEANGEKHETKEVEAEVTPEVKELKEDKKFTELVNKVEALENKVKSLIETQEANVKNIAEFTKNIESDEVVAEDHIFLALNAVQQGLRSENKDTGKALQQLNIVLNSLKDK